MSSPFPFSTSNSPAVIQHKRSQILEALIKADPRFGAIPVLSVKYSTLQLMLQYYDAVFLGGILGQRYHSIKVTASSRLLSAAGKFIHPKTLTAYPDAEIRMSSDFLFRMKEGPFELNGLTVPTPQEAFLVVFEHELCHAVEFAYYGATGHSSRFMYFARGVFGHTKHTHELPTIAAETTQKTGISVGSHVSFPYEGQTLSGIVSYLGKSARVMVPSPRGNYYMNNDHSKTYLKYQVPVSLLTRIP